MRLVAAAAAALAALAWLRGHGRARRRLVAAAPGAPRAAAPATVAVLAAVGGGGLAAGLSPWVLLLTVTAAGLGALTLRRRRQARLLRDCDVDTVALSFGVAAELRAGRPPGAALGAVAPHLGVLRAEVGAAARAVGRGADLAGELALLAGRWDRTRLRAVCSAWSATAASGAGVADVLDRLGESFETDDRIADEMAAAAAGPRATIAVLAVLPALGIALGTGIGLAPMRVLLHTRAGALLIAGAAVLDGCGLLWVRRIMAGALRA